MKGKRGQMFLVGAIIFVFALYTVVIPYNTVKTYPGLDDYKDLSENYQAEFPRVFNWALYKGENVEDSLGDFNTAFTDQARSVDPNFGVFYTFVDSDGAIHIVNTLNNKAIIITYEDPVSLEQLEVTLVGDVDSEGEICIEGLGCSSARASTSDFDRTYYQTTLENPPDQLRISIAGRPESINVDLTEHFSGLTYTTSEERISRPEGEIYDNIEVSFETY